jgi:hypothetical protein
MIVFMTAITVGMAYAFKTNRTSAIIAGGAITAGTNLILLLISFIKMKVENSKS